MRVDAQAMLIFEITCKVTFLFCWKCTVYLANLTIDFELIINR